jgi:hypothetical protein
MSDKVSEYFNRVLPLGGNPGTVQSTTLKVIPTPTSIDVRTLFGNVGIGDFWTVKAEGPLSVPTGQTWRAYISLTPRAGTNATPLSSAASGYEGWPLSDMQEISGKLTGGKAQTFATSPSLPGFSTGLQHTILNINCSVGSGLLHVMRHTLPGSMDAGQFRPPVGSAMYPPGPSGWIGPYA